MSGSAESTYAADVEVALSLECRRHTAPPKCGTERSPSHQSVVHPGHDSIGQCVTRRLRHIPHFDIAQALHLCYETTAALRHGGDHRPATLDHTSCGFDERLLQAFHLADFVYEVDGRAVAGIPQRRRESIDRRHVNAVLAHARGWEVDMGNDRLFATERDQAESTPIAALTNFLCVKSDQMKSCKLACRCAEDGRLADPGPSRQEQSHTEAYLDRLVLSCVLGFAYRRVR